jgi:hypothetical protein
MTPFLAEAVLNVQSYSTPDELKALLLASKADRIIISAHGGTGYFDAGGGDMERSARLRISDFKDDLANNTLFEKIEFHHCAAGDRTSWIQGINILRSYYGLEPTTKYPFDR